MTTQEAILFEVITDHNSAIITLNNNLTGYTVTWLIGTDLRDIRYACVSFAKQQKTSLVNIGYAIQFPSEQVDNFNEEEVKE